MWYDVMCHSFAGILTNNTSADVTVVVQKIGLAADVTVRQEDHARVVRILFRSDLTC